MFTLLFARTFYIVAGMLIITAASAYMNKESKPTGTIMIILLFALLFAIIFFWDIYPINLVLVSVFAGIMWWIISPTIKSMGVNMKLRSFLKEQWIVLKKWETLTAEQIIKFDEYLTTHPSDEQWNKIVAQAMFSTAFAVFATASLVFISDIDFSFMWMFLFVALLVLIIMGLLNMFIFKSRLLSLIKAYCGVIIFTWYLIYDFNTLEKAASDQTWGTAVSIAVNIYLDIINLFLDLLQILWWGDN